MNPLALMQLGLAFAGCATTTTARLRLPEVQTVPHVDRGRHVGTWYIVQRLAAQGYETNRLVRTVHGRAPAPEQSSAEAR